MASLIKRSIVILITFSNSIFSQDPNMDNAYLKKRFNFAHMYFGVEGLLTTSGSTPVLNNANGIENVQFNGCYAPRLIWGGTHFWGHADFYVSIPIANIKQKTPSGLSSLKYNLGVETGFKIYPFKLKSKTIRPYIGMAWNNSGFQQTQKNDNIGIALAKNTTPIVTGLSFRSKAMIFEAGLQYFFQNKYKYPVNRITYGDIKLPQFAFTFSMKFLMETTNQNGANIKKKLNALEKYNKYNAFYFGLGISASIGIPRFSTYDKVKYPFFKNHKRYIGIIPDLTFGYYLAKSNLCIGISYRNMGDKYEGFGVQHLHRRQSIMFETFKFLGDYHGFVPFVGVTASHERLFFATRDKDVDNTWNKYSKNKVGVGIILGWDIQPTKAESWLLRTNLRYTPISMKVDNLKVAFDYIEFNFIQLVIFPERIKAQRKYRKLSTNP